MRRLINGKLILGLLTLSLFWGCTDKIDDHYDTPDWLKGSAWEVLESSGNYKIFLEGIERAGFRQMVDGKSMLTVMAPDDAAFKTYFAEKGKGSLDDFSDVEVSQLIGFHLLYYSYNTEKLINFRPEGDGITEDKASVGAGLFYKHRTKSQDTISTYTMESDSSKRVYKIYHNERFLPVFSYRYFNTTGIEAQSNYEYFYPNSTWTGSTSFNVSNASLVEDPLIASTVGEKEVVVGNGYIYSIDQVLEPLETIYSELEKDSNYSQFLKYYNKESYVTYDEDISSEYGGGDSLYYLRHNAPLADIACEWPVSSYAVIGLLSSQSYTIFAPSNDAINNFYNNFWAKGGYTSLDEVNSIAFRYLLYNCVYTGGLAFPESISNGDIINSFATEIKVDVDNVPATNRSICSNGMLYKLPELNVPLMFESVTGPVFQNKDFTYFLCMLDKTDMAASLISDESRFTLLVPSNTQCEHNDYLMNGETILDATNEAVSTTILRNIVNMHVASGDIDLTTDGVYETNTSKIYWFVKDGKITTSVLFNEILETSAVDLEGNPQSDPDPYLQLTKLEGDWSNGNAYTYEYESPSKASSDVVLLPATDNSILSKIATLNDKNYKYYEFTSLLRLAGLSDGTNLNVGSSLFFIPTNTAIQNAIAAGKIPGVDINGELKSEEDAQVRLQLYMRQYIVSTQINGISKYPYLGSGQTGYYKNSVVNVNDKGEYEYVMQLHLVDDGGSLKIATEYNGVETSFVKVVDTYDYFPFAYPDGCVHFIEDVLEEAIPESASTTSFKEDIKE